LSYDFTVKPTETKHSDSGSSSNRKKRSEKSSTPDRSFRSPEPFSLPVNLGSKLSSRSSPSLVLQLRDEERNKEIPKPDYSPMQIRKSGQFIKKVLKIGIKIKFKVFLLKIPGNIIILPDPSKINFLTNIYFSDFFHPTQHFNFGQIMDFKIFFLWPERFLA